jgi:hypothetical protein
MVLLDERGEGAGIRGGRDEVEVSGRTEPRGGAEGGGDGGYAVAPNVIDEIPF